MSQSRFRSIQMLIGLSATAILAERELGPPMSEFHLGGSSAPLLKPTASSQVTLPPEGERLRALARVTSAFDPASLAAYG